MQGTQGFDVMPLVAEAQRDKCTK